jgi:hypothetical protein
MPPEMVEGMSSDPMMQAVAPTMPYDFEVMGDLGGGTIPEDLPGRQHPDTRDRWRSEPGLPFGTPPPGSRRSCRAEASPFWRVRTTARPPTWSHRWLPSADVVLTLLVPLAILCGN